MHEIHTHKLLQLRGLFVYKLASDSNTIQARRYIIQPGRLQAATRENNIYVWVWFSLVSLIAVFVWGRAVCGTRYWFSACPSCRAVFQNIQLRRIRCVQGVMRYDHFDIVHNLGTFDEAEWKFWRP